MVYFEDCCHFHWKTVYHVDKGICGQKDRFIYVGIFVHSNFKSGLPPLTRQSLFWASNFSPLFFLRKRDKSENRETDRERALVVFGWMWRAGDLRSLQNLNYLLALLQPATIRR